jgi:hypothetical protein
VDQVELLLEDAVVGLLGDVVGEDLHVFLAGDLAVFYHVEERTPDQGTAQDVGDLAQVLREELDGMWVENMLNERPILIVQQHSLVSLGAIISHCRLLLGHDPSFDLINLKVILKECHPNIMHPQRRMLRQHCSLLDRQLSLLVMVIDIPEGLNLVQTGSFKPDLLPLIKCEVLVVEVVLHAFDEVV